MINLNYYCCFYWFYSLATERDQSNRLFEELSKDNQSWGNPPFKKFKICTMRKGSDDKEGDSLPQCAFDIQFEKDLVENDRGGSDKKYEGRIGLWNATIRPRNVLDINMMSLDKLVLFIFKINMLRNKDLKI